MDLNALPKSAAEAIAIGSAHYFDGKPCKHGHLAAKLARNRYCRDCAAERYAAWYEKNRAKKNAADLKWYKEHPAAPRKTPRKNYYYPEKNAEKHRNRRARQKKAAGRHTDADVREIRLRQRDLCACCSAALHGKGHVDHVVALSKGGSNWPSNLQVLCAPCNLEKGNRDPLEFLQSRGKLS